MEVRSDQAVDELLRRGRDAPPSLQHRPQSQVVLVPVSMGAQASLRVRGGSARRTPQTREPEGVHGKEES